MRRVAATLVAAAIWTLFVRAQTPTPTPQPQQPVFRGGTDVVSVNVSVRASGAAVANLQASDFVLLDNGVRQRIQSVELEAVPADVTVLVETSDAVSASIGSMSDQVQKIAALVRPFDRLSIVDIDTYVTELLPMQPVLNPELGKLTGGGRSSANDALAAALLRHVDPDRPHLIIAITNAVDTMSALDLATVRGLARESSGVLHVALIDIGEDFPDPPAKPFLKSSQQRLNSARCGTSFQCSLTHLFWRARDDRPFGLFHYEDFDPLREAAEITGGKMYLPGVFTDRTAAGIFNKVFADYRQGYVLRYTPQGVKREGWHELSVTLPSQSSYTVHARRGYAIDAPKPAPSPVSESALATVIASYGRGDYGTAMRTLRAAPDRAKAIRDFRSGGNPWPGDPHREAIFALELAGVGLLAHRDDAQQAAWELLKSYTKLVRRPLTPDEFERSWLWTEIAMLEGALQPNATDAAVDSALKRFADEPRFLLARAVVADQRALLGLTPNPFSAVTDLGAAYDAAIAHAETATEGRIRKAWYLHRRGQHNEALALLDAADGRISENALAYLRELFRGHVLLSLGRGSNAIGAYRAAHALSPDAQSATVALMNALYTQGDRREAETLSEAIQSATRETGDPWWAYWQGDYRFYPAIIGRLRAALQ